MLQEIAPPPLIDARYASVELVQKCHQPVQASVDERQLADRPLYYYTPTFIGRGVMK